MAGLSQEERDKIIAAILPPKTTAGSASNKEQVQEIINGVGAASEKKWPKKFWEAEQFRVLVTPDPKDVNIVNDELIKAADKVLKDHPELLEAEGKSPETIKENSKKVAELIVKNIVSSADFKEPKTEAEKAISRIASTSVDNKGNTNGIGGAYAKGVQKGLIEGAQDLITNNLDAHLNAQKTKDKQVAMDNSYNTITKQLIDGVSGMAAQFQQLVAGISSPQGANLAVNDPPIGPGGTGGKSRTA